LLAFNPATSRVIGFNPLTGVIDDRSPVTTGLSGSVFGTALGYPNNPHATFYVLESMSGITRLLALELNGVDNAFNVITTISSAGFEFYGGLGQLDGQFYSLQSSASDPDTIVRINPNTNPAIPERVMVPGINFDIGLAADPGRGTLVFAGRLPTDLALGNGTPGVLGEDAVVMEVDPRINYIFDAVSNLNDDFAVGVGTVTNIASLTPQTATFSEVTVLGISFFNATAGNPLSLPAGKRLAAFSVNAVINGSSSQFLTLIFDPDLPNNVPSFLLAIYGQNAMNPLFDFANEPRLPAAPPRVLLPAAVRGVDLNINPLFAQMAFSADAHMSGVVERIAREEILRTAINPAGCISSGALSTLNSTLAANIDRTAGVGTSILDFRQPLPVGHPCSSMGPRPRRR